MNTRLAGTSQLPNSGSLGPAHERKRAGLTESEAPAGDLA